MGAAENNEDSWNGVVEGTGESGNNTNVPLSWRATYVRARTIIQTTLNKVAFNWPNPASPSSTSTYDQVQGAAEQVGWRYIDSYGQVWDNVKLSLVQIEWLQDGAPTPLAQAQLAEYVAKASVLRPWPTGFVGAFPGDPQQTYPAWPVAAPVPAAPVVDVPPADVPVDAPAASS